MKVKFNLNNPRRKETSIMLIFHQGGTKFKKSTGLSIKTKQWSKKKQRALLSNGYSQGEAINKQLTVIEQKFYEALSNLGNKRKDLTHNALKREFEQQLNNNQPAEKITHVTEYLDVFFEKKSKGTVGFSTLQTYITVKNHLNEWLGTKKMYFSDLQLDDYNKFSNFLYKRGLADRTVIKHLKKLSAIVNYAIKDKNTAADKNPFSLKDLNLRIPSSDSIYLDPDEIKKLWKLELSKNSLKRARDLFVFLCLTGLRFNDAFKISPDSIRRGTNVDDTHPILHMSISKGGSKIAVPLSRYSQQILERYNYSFPKISNQKFNSYIKEVCEKGAIDELINKRRFVKGQAIDNYVPKFQLVSSHTGRRSFVTNALRAELSFDQVMKMTGHKSLTTFQKYIRHDEMSNASQLTKHSFFNL